MAGNPDEEQDESARVAPLFPLPNVILVPGMAVPLHVFEPRYRQMVQHLLDGSGRLLGITYAIPSDVRMDKFVYHVHVDEIRSFLEREPEKGPAIPDAWRLGPVASLSKSSPGATQHDVIVAGTRRPEQVPVPPERV